MIKIVEFKDNSIAIGNNNEDFREYVEDFQIDRKSKIVNQYLVCKDEVDKSILKHEL